MAAGDVTNPKRVRWVSNQRVDAVDANGLSEELREHSDSITRAVLATPLNQGGTIPVGTILTGFGLTLNPTGGADGKVRINSPLGVALDADNRYIVKPFGETLDVIIPAGTHQVYVYYTEVATDDDTRRVISSTSPFTESPKTVATKYQSTFAAYVRSGNETNIVAEASVNGKTRALVLIGVATNTAGAIAITGYNATTAPNGTLITNRMSSIPLPASFPTNNAMSGSPKNLLDLIGTLGHMLGQAVWKGSTALAPSFNNNFGAYSEADYGIKKIIENFASEQTLKNLIVTGYTHFTGSYTYNLTGGSLASWLATPTVNSNIDVRGGGLNLTDVYEVRITKTGTYAAVGGLVGGVDGKEILLTSAVGFYVKDEDTGSTNINRIKVPYSDRYNDTNFPAMKYVPPGAGLRLRYIGAVSRWYVVGASDSEDIAYPLKTMIIPPTMAQYNTAHVFDEHEISLNGVSTRVIYPIQIPFTDYWIHSWKLYLKKNTAAAATVSARLYRSDSAGATALATGATNNEDAVGFTSMSEGDIAINPLGLSSGVRSHYLRVTPSASVSPGIDRLLHLEVTFLAYG